MKTIDIEVSYTVTVNVGATEAKINNTHECYSIFHGNDYVCGSYNAEEAIQVCDELNRLRTMADAYLRMVGILKEEKGTS